MKLILSFVAVALLIFFFIRFLEQKSLYFPFPTLEITPQDMSMEYEDVHLTASDGTKLHGWFIPSESSKAAVLLAHGNGGNISHRLEKLKMLHDTDLDILIFDYRGYGLSSGSPSEDGIYLDVQAFYDYLVNEKNLSADSIIGYGESLGGAVIINLAKGYRLGGIILEGAFTSVPDMARKLIPFMPSALLKTRFDSFNKIGTIKVPKLFFHSTSDEVVPFELGRRLFEAAQGPKEFVQLHGGHNDAFMVSQDEYVGHIHEFVSNIMNDYH